MKINIKFIKDVAENEGKAGITDKQAKKAHEYISEISADQDYYYKLKEYFQN